MLVSRREWCEVTRFKGSLAETFRLTSRFLEQPVAGSRNTFSETVSCPQTPCLSHQNACVLFLFDCSLSRWGLFPRKSNDLGHERLNIKRICGLSFFLCAGVQVFAGEVSDYKHLSFCVWTTHNILCHFNQGQE